ncbi:cytochrome P450, partial [Amanita rubescens]
MDAKITFVFAVAILFSCFLSAWKKHRKLSGIPTIGPSGILGSYIGALRFLRDGRAMVQEGYDKYRGSIFKIPMMTQWMVVVTGPQLFEDVRKASDDELSFLDAAAEMIHTDLLLGRETHEDTSHIDVVRSHLTRNIAARFSDVQDEIAAAFPEYIPTKGNEWTTVTARKTILGIVCRAVNRMLVGLPLCRDPDYRLLNENFTVDIVIAASIINMFPISLRHIVAKFLRKVPNGIKRGIQHLQPLIEERIKQEAQYGKDWPDKPNDAISWLLDVAKEPHRRSIKNLTIRILLLNFVAIHTTTMAVTTALFYLATHPEYVQPMREEVETVINADGWTKAAVGRLSKVDSFLKESQRLSGGGLLTVTRKAVKDFTFSNGMTIPAGSLISVPHRCVHQDAENYPDPDIFDGFRFAKKREQEGESTKHGMATPTPDFMVFGHGRHACPGRFFAANEIKAMLAYILLNYDVKMANDRGLPAEWWFGSNSSPDPTAEVMFRK